MRENGLKAGVSTRMINYDEFDLLELFQGAPVSIISMMVS